MSSDQFNPQNPMTENELHLNEEKIDCSLKEYSDDPECILENDEIIFFVVHIFTTVMCLIGVILLLISIIKGNRLNSWKLYVIVSLCVFSWITLTLYQDYLDRHFIKKIYPDPNARSIYNGIQNLFHGLALFLTVILLAHLSDIQKTSRIF